MKLKQSIRCACGALAIFAVGAALNAQAQETTTTTSVSTTTMAGTVSALDANTISVTTEESTSPVSYRFSEQTTFVDASGNVVSRDVIRSGVPVTVYYAGDADARTVSRVVVRESAPAAVVEEETTTTTTTTVD